MMTASQLIPILAVFWYVLVCGLVCWVASEKDRSAAGFFFAALFCTPVIAVLVLIALPEKRKSGPLR